MDGFFIGCICFLFGAFVGLFLLSLIIRASVWTANQCLGTSTRARPEYHDDEEDWDAYDRPVRRRGRSAIPEPGVFKGIGIAIVWVLVAGVIGLVFRVALEEVAFVQRGAEVPLIVGVCCLKLVVDFLLCAALLASMLPTSFGRGSLVALFVSLILIVILVAVGVVLGAAGLLAGWR